MDDNFSLMDYFALVVRRWRLIGIVVLGSCVLTVLATLFISPYYTARTTLFPPENDRSSFTDLMVSSPIALPSAGLNDPIRLLMATLRSRTVAEGVIGRLDLLDVLDAADIEEGVKELRKWTTIAIVEVGVGVIRVEVEAPIPQLAAAVANAYVAELDRLNRALNTAKAEKRRLFLAQRLEQAQQTMLDAGEALRQFQEQHQALSLTAQTEATIKAMAKVEEQIQELEIELSLKRLVLKEPHPDVVQLKSRLALFKDRFVQVKQGRADTTVGKGGGESLYIGLDRTPMLAMELRRLTREFNAREAFFGLLLRDYQQAFLQETDNSSTVQVLDPAVPPLRKSGPKLKLMVGIAGTMSLLGGVLLVFLLEHIGWARKEGGD